MIHRSPRYQNPQFPWGRVVEAYAGRVAMVGSDSEHDEFCRRFGMVRHVRTDDLLELAQVIAGAKIFCGKPEHALLDRRGAQTSGAPGAIRGQSQLRL